MTLDSEPLGALIDHQADLQQQLNALRFEFLCLTLAVACLAVLAVRQVVKGAV